MINITGTLRNYWKEIGFEDNADFLSVNSSGYQKLVTKNLSFARNHGRIDFQIIYIIHGKGYFTFSGEEIEVEKGNVIVYTPGQPQHYRYCFKDSTELYWIHFTGYGAMDCLSQLKLADRNVYQIGIDDECMDPVKKITYELQVKRPAFEAVTAAYLMEFMGLISRRLDNINTNSPAAKSSDIKKALTYMHSNYSKRLTVDELAEKCNLSAFWFIHKFKAYTGMAPMEYLTKIRIDAAKELISNSSLSMGEVAGVVGYENQMYFSRVFKNQTGMSPTAYRNTRI